MKKTEGHGDQVWFFSDDKAEGKARQSDNMRALLVKDCINFKEFKNGRDGNFDPKEWNLPCIMSRGHIVYTFQGVENYIDFLKHFGRVKILPED